jgi:hypothetical protein
MRIILTYLKKKRSKSGQSFVELALTFTVILLLLAGLVEVGFVFFSYLTVLDQTREAARFASIRDYTEGMDTYLPTAAGQCPENPLADGVTDYCDACRDDWLDYFYDTACFFIDSDLNPYITFSAPNLDDVAITVFTINDNNVSDRWPDDSDGVWSLNNDNWKKDCDGTVVHTEPFLTDDEIEAMFVANAPEDRGLVLVEGYYCYDLLLDLPIFAQIVPSPFRIHAYTIMPASEAIPTPTPIPPP